MKNPGGVFSPASDIDLERLQRFKTGETYTAEIKLTRNPQFNFIARWWVSSAFASSTGALVALAFANMKHDRFESVNRALINAAIKHVFANTNDQSILNRLQAFFWGMQNEKHPINTRNAELEQT